MLDLDATDDPLHGEQEGRFFHGYYDAATATCRCTSSAGSTCCCARLRPANQDAAARSGARRSERIVAQIRERWPEVQIVLRGDSRLLPRGDDGVVRGERGRLRVRPGAQRAAASEMLEPALAEAAGAATSRPGEAARVFTSSPTDARRAGAARGA